MLEILNALFASNGFVPHGHCYLWKPGLVSLHVLSDSLIALAYTAISITLVYLVRKTRLPFHGTFLAFGLFIAACGMTHAMEVWTLWHPIYWLAGVLKAITALASVATALWIPALVPEVATLIQSAKVAEERRLQLEAANQELETLYQRVKGLDQLKTQFFTNISHELRTPLTLLLGPAEQLLTQTTLTPGQRQNVEQIDRNAHMLLKYVNDLLDIAKLEVNKMGMHYASVDLVQLIRLVTAHFEPVQISRQVVLRVDTPEAFLMQADAEKLQRVLFNLLANAFKFAPVGGEVRCGLEQQGSKAVIIVQDNGPGVPTDQRQMIFERFQQAHQNSQQRSGGTGLGLAIAKEFVELHDGSIGVEEAPGGGALFRIQIPLAAPPEAELETQPVSPPVTAALARQSLADLEVDVAAPAAVPPVAPASTSDLSPSGDRPLVLVVEDNPDMRQFVADVLAIDYQVVVAANGQEGLEQAIALQPDLILTDMMMPVMDGEHLVQAIRASSQLDKIPLIVLTAKADDQLRVRMLQAGVQDYMMKPFAAAELQVRVQNLIAMKQVREVLQQELVQQRQSLLTVSNTATLRKQELQSALTTLRQIDTRFRRVFESSLIGILFWDNSGNITEANDTFLQTFGYTLADLQAGLNWQTITPAPYPVLNDQLLAQIAAGGSEPFEQELICKNGNQVPVLVGVAQLEDMPAQGVAFVLDITQRKQAEIALQHAYDQLELRVEQRTQELSQTNIWLQEQIAERQKVEADLRISRESIQVLYEVVANQQLTFTEKMQQLLELGCQRYQLGVGILSQVTGDRYEVVEVKLCPEYLSAAQGDAEQVILPAIASGDVFDLGQTYCCETLKASEPISFEQAGRSPLWQGHPCYLATQLEAYIATPILVSGEIYGTLGFSSPLPHSTPFTAGDKKFLQLMALWIGGEIARQQAEDALVQEQEFLKVLLDNLNVGIVACNADGVLTLFNQATREFHGLPEEPVPALEWAQHYNLYEADGQTRMPIENVPLFRAWKGERIHNQEMIIAPNQGPPRILLASGQAIVEPEGRNLGAVVVMHDITERKLAEDRLRQSESTLRSFYNSASMMMGVVELIGDEDIVHISDNSAAAQFFGLTTLAMQNQRASEMGVPQSYLQEWIRHYRLAEDTQSPVRFEYRHAGEQEDKWLSVTVCFIAVGSNGRSRFSYVVEDISDRKQAEAQIRTLNAELEQRVIERTAQLEAANRAKDELLVREQQARSEAESANRMKDEFLATLSHELRTPLNAILGWAQLLRSRKFDPETMTRALETIERNARAQTQLIGDILDVSRIIQGNLRLNVRTIHLIAVIEAALDSVRPAAEAKGIQIRADYNRSIHAIWGDPDRLQQVVWNLLSNAIKFTPRGGQVEVRLESIPGTVTVMVQDNGQGIKAEFLPHVFERFRQADSSITRSHGGLGLGLAIVRHLIELHGGTVQVASEGEGQGATFTVSLPISMPGLEMAPIPEQSELSGANQVLPEPLESGSVLAHAPSLSGLRVLVVEDEADTRDFLQTLLAHSQAEVLAAASVKSAIEILTGEAAGRWPDILISDVGMPEEDGYDLIRRVHVIAQERGVYLPAIALTAYASADDQARLLRAGFQVHLPKPVDSAELIAVIATLVGRMDTSPHLM